MTQSERNGLVIALLDEHTTYQEFKGHSHWLSCGCDVAKGLRQAQGFGDPGLRWDPSFGGGWVTAPAERLEP